MRVKKYTIFNRFIFGNRKNIVRPGMKILVSAKYQTAPKVVYFSPLKGAYSNQTSIFLPIAQQLDDF